MSGSAAERLAQTRQAILDQALHRRRSPLSSGPEGSDRPPSTATATARAASGSTADGEPGPSPSWGSWRAAGSRYWQDHPARALLEMARPGMAAWGSRSPWAFLACSAIAGGVIVIARPWKLISVTGVLVAIAKAAAIQAANRPQPFLKEPP